MITNLLPYILGTVYSLGGLFLFLLSFGFYTPKFKTETKQDKFKSGMQKFGKLLKVMSIPIIIYGLYLLIFGNSEMFKLNTKNEIHEEWTAQDSAEFVNSCIKSAGASSWKESRFAIDYCNCAFQKIKSEYTYQQYLEILKLSESKQQEIYEVLLSDCWSNYENQNSTQREKTDDSTNNDVIY